MKLKSILVALSIIATLVAVPASAAVIDPCLDPDLVNTELCAAASGDDSLFGANSIWNNILNALTFVVGAIAVLMIIIGSIRYAVSGGDQAQVTSAKNTIIYAVVALIVAVMANAIVNFVLTNI
ncbi:MAG TPA: pilin [Candidatus Saccharimonadales bacterium]|nr:pilin [Candidatus Saccharimonadales bacterium]